MGLRKLDIFNNSKVNYTNENTKGKNSQAKSLYNSLTESNNNISSNKKKMFVYKLAKSSDRSFIQNNKHNKSGIKFKNDLSVLLTVKINKNKVIPIFDLTYNNLNNPNMTISTTNSIIKKDKNFISKKKFMTTKITTNNSLNKNKKDKINKKLLKKIIIKSNNIGVNNTFHNLNIHNNIINKNKTLHNSKEKNWKKNIFINSNKIFKFNDFKPINKKLNFVINRQNTMNKFSLKNKNLKSVQNTKNKINYFNSFNSTVVFTKNRKIKNKENININNALTHSIGTIKNKNILIKELLLKSNNQLGKNKLNLKKKD